jgi:predicted Zn-dependent protease
MTSPDPNKAWALFMSDPADFIAMFAAVAVAVAAFTWWLRHFIGKERIATLEERLKLSKEKYDTSTEDIQRLTTVAARLQSEVAKLQSALPSPALRPQLNALQNTSALISKSVTDLSTANNALGAVLWVPNENRLPTAERISSIKPSA